jgi:predicted cobalt transporter CbtA
MGNLLLRGMLVGLLAGIVCFAFLRLAGEPSVDRAIAFEAAGSAEGHNHDTGHDTGHDSGHPAVAPAPGHSHGEAAPVSRPTQAGIGLLTAVAVYGAALGGLFALGFALVYGRWQALGPRGTAALLAASGFVAVYLIPFLKYPPNPPAVGSPETIGARTALYVAMLALSLGGMIAAHRLRGRLARHLDGWNAALLAGAAYLAAMAAVGFLLPVVDELPAGFPAATLWSFRIASLGGQALLWGIIGLGFGLLTHRVARRAPGARLGVAVV